MHSIQLTDVQIKNLLVFLNRTNISGNESEILTQLKMLLARELEKEEVKPPKEK